MDRILYDILNYLPTLVLVAIVAITIYTLGKGADILVDQSVILSIKWGVPKIIIGATIISIGTTLPETTVSVMAAIKGQSGLALGNGIGSVIANTGLILGIAALIGTVPIDKTLIKRQGFVKAGTIVLFLIITFPFFGLTTGGSVSRIWGIVFLVLLTVYLFFSVRWAKGGQKAAKGKDYRKSVSDGFMDVSDDIYTADNNLDAQDTDKHIALIFVKLAAGIVLVVVSSKILIQSVEITAIRIGIPESVIAATLVAFGTSLPELMMSVNSVRRGHGELALGNVIGANILNILFVIGAAAAVSKGGLAVPVNYYYLQFPVLLLMGILFLGFCAGRKGYLTKIQGTIFVFIYLIYTVLNFVLPF